MSVVKRIKLFVHMVKYGLMEYKLKSLILLPLYFVVVIGIDEDFMLDNITEKKEDNNLTKHEWELVEKKHAEIAVNGSDTE